jgi:uncharacterized protein YegP (UPF0339 family)
MNIQDISKLFDLEYFDGPLLSLFADSEGNSFLFKWYDLHEDAHQWLVFEVKYASLQSYLSGAISEYSLLSDEEGKAFFLLQFSEKGIPTILKKMPQQQVLDEFEGLKWVFFKPELCPNWKSVQHFFHDRHDGLTSNLNLGATPEAPANTQAKFIVSLGSDNLYCFCLLDNNGQALMKSDACQSRSNAQKVAHPVRELLPSIDLLRWRPLAMGKPFFRLVSLNFSPNMPISTAKFA